MRVFITGATGFIGSAIVKELIAAGHQAVGLSRSEANAKALAAAGAEVHRGSLEDLDSLRSGAAESDGVIHAGFIHDFRDFSKWKQNCEIDRLAIEALASGLRRSDRPLIVTSGTALLPPGRLTTEETAPFSGPGAIPRVASEEAVTAAAWEGVRAAILRLPPSVHGEGDHAFVPLLIDLARKKGAAAYIGEGNNRWPAVHRLDAANLYRLILESNFPAGAKFHAVADEGVPFRKLAEVIAKRLNVPLVSKSPQEAADHFGWFAHFAALDCPTSSARTQQRLAWKPKELGLIADVDNAYYFKS